MDPPGTTSHSPTMQIEEPPQKQKPLPHPTSIKLNIHSYGFGGVRYDNILLLSQNEALIPIGACIALWDIKRGRRLELIQSNTDSIFVLLNSAYFIISISYSGQISLIEHKSLRVLKQFHTKGRIVRHAHVNDQYLAVSCEKYKLKKGITVVYKLSDIYNDHDNSSSTSSNPKPIYSLKGRHRFATLSNPHTLITLVEKLVITDAEQQQ